MQDLTDREKEATTRYLQHDDYLHGRCLTSPYVADATLPLEEQYAEIERCDTLMWDDWPFTFAVTARGINAYVRCRDCHLPTDELTPTFSTPSTP